MNTFIKTFSDERTAREAARRSIALRHQGLTTPDAQSVQETVRFARLDGLSGLPLAQVPAQQWLAPLANLHESQLSDVAPFDPSKRIRPRLDLLTAPELRNAFARLTRAVPRGSALIHGDFHLGQVIRDPGGTTWMIDLDDLCIGPPEADLGNLIANLATQARLPGDFATRLTGWRRRILEAWARLAAPAHPATVDHFTALALIRRHLKLREQANADFETEIARWVTPVACRTSPSDSAAYPV